MFKTFPKNQQNRGSARHSADLRWLDISPPHGGSSSTSVLSLGSSVDYLNAHLIVGVKASGCEGRLVYLSGGAKRLVLIMTEQSERN